MTSHQIREFLQSEDQRGYQYAQHQRESQDYEHPRSYPTLDQGNRRTIMLCSESHSASLFPDSTNERGKTRDTARSKNVR